MMDKMVGDQGSTSQRSWRQNLAQGKFCRQLRWLVEDRKSTRLNSSNANISYAVFCLKKKNNTREGISRNRAHLHFEINFLLNPKLHIWYPKQDPKAPPFGDLNSKNIIGLNPAAFSRT